MRPLHCFRLTSENSPRKVPSSTAAFVRFSWLARNDRYCGGGARATPRECLWPSRIPGPAVMRCVRTLRFVSVRSSGTTLPLYVPILAAFGIT
eukprot:1077214-Prymnesium_polylepis.1